MVEKHLLPRHVSPQAPAGGAGARRHRCQQEQQEGLRGPGCHERCEVSWEGSERVTKVLAVWRRGEL